MAGLSHINKLPSELLQHTFSLLGRDDICRIRLVSKHMSANVQEIFIKDHIVDQYYPVLHWRTLQILEQITAHEQFGRRVQRITFNSAICTSRDDQFGILNRNLLKQILANIKYWGNDLSLGVADIHLDEDESQLYDGANQIHLVPIDASIHQSPDKVLDFALDCAARKSSCKVREIRLVAPAEMSCKCGLFASGAHSGLLSSVSYILSKPNLKFEICLNHDDDELEPEVFSYDGKRKRISISGMEISRHSSDYAQFVHNVIDVELSKAGIREVEIKNSTIRNSRTFRSHLVKRHARTLESIRLHRVTIFRKRHWGSEIRLLSTLPRLKHCSLELLMSLIPRPSGLLSHDSSILNILVELEQTPRKELFRTAESYFDAKQRGVSKHKALIELEQSPEKKLSRTAQFIFQAEGSGVSKALRMTADVCAANIQAEIDASRHEHRAEHLATLKKFSQVAADDTSSDPADEANPGQSLNYDEENAFQPIDVPYRSYDEYLDSKFRWASDSDNSDSGWD